MTQKKAAPPENIKTSLVVPLAEASERVADQSNKGKDILNTRIGTEEELHQAKAHHRTWKDFTKELLNQIFNTDDIAAEFAKLGGAFIAYLDYVPSLQEKINDLNEDLGGDLERLSSIYERLELFPVTVSGPPPEATGPAEIVELIARRFHVVARQLRQRHDNRSTIEIADEYDVQDLLHALLKIFFNDIRPEEWTPSYAEGASRMDFLLKAEQVVVELKKSRQGLAGKQVADQLLIDIARYRTHPDCRSLICFVYDPDGRIANPDGLESDLSQPVNGVPVKVIVAPKGQ